MSSGRRVLATWGNGGMGRLGLTGSGEGALVPTVVRDLWEMDVTAVACGAAHTLAVTENGQVFSCGLNDAGQLGTAGGESSRFGPVALPQAAATVAAGYRHSLALDASGRVWAWGEGGHGALGLGRDLAESQHLPRLVRALQGETIVQIAAGAHHSLAVTDKGELFSWGADAENCLGHASPSHSSWSGKRMEWLPRVVRALESHAIVQASGGLAHSAALTRDGFVFTWGDNRGCALGVPNMTRSHTPLKVAAPPASCVSCGGSHTLIATLSGEVLAWGSNDKGALGARGGNAHASPEPVVLPAPIAKLAAGWQHSLALAVPDAGLFSWGWGGSQGTQMGGTPESDAGQLGLGDDRDRWEPQRVTRARLEGEGGAGELRLGEHAAVLDVAAGLNHSAAVLRLLQ